MKHPKMQYTYVGIDSHKDTHTAVFMDCFFEKTGELTFDNLPSKFGAFLTDALTFQSEGTTLIFGLEDTSAYGRALTVFLRNNGYTVKHANAMLVSRERKNSNITHKSDSFDAECAARVLLSKFRELPNISPQDDYWILRTLVVRRGSIIRSNTSLKNHLHNLLTMHYPNYRSFFNYIDCDTSLAFFTRYPSPGTLKGVTAEELAGFLREPSCNLFGTDKALFILGSIEDNAIAFQEIRDIAVQSTIRQLRFNMQELEQLEATLGKVLEGFNTTLTSMNGLDVVSASQLLSCIGDIKRFPTPAKLARYSGIAPVTYASGKNKAVSFFFSLLYAQY